MKILRVITRLNIGGPAIQAIDLSIGLNVKYGHETVLVYGIPEEGEVEIDKKNELKENNIKSIFIPTLKRGINLFDDLKSFLSIRIIIKEEKPDIIHSHMTKAGTLTRLAALTLWNRPKLVHTFHGTVLDGYFGTWRTWLIKCVEGYLAKQTDILITISNQQKDNICNKHKIVCQSKVRVVPLGFDLSKIGERPGSSNDGFVDIGIIGRLAEVKNHKLFIEFFSQLKESLADRTLGCCGFIIGDGTDKYMKELQYTAKAYPILFSGYIDHSEILKLYSTLDLVVCTSINEGTPVSLIEAMAAKVLVASTKVGGVEGLIGFENNPRGLYIDPDNLYDSVDRIADYLVNPYKYKQITNRAYDYVQKEHLLDELLVNIYGVYYKLMTNDMGN